ncbi:Serine/threonine-protein kinase afsK [Fibrella aestuarina BUZ 2]|uniref:Serine/threonine-protein kinase afsK n=1 Tax=Fibrella aestuarina BUZ 2 TaxID=1166018 RepID=I0K5G2_9BACT|nr:PQQ-binding-like beta-propeller repeat protein [Fibrella aestuarina]CCG99365.1 Serine/threonine-protein kinase afsK [Fibrella aestuarina BUZ 2]
MSFSLRYLRFSLLLCTSLVTCKPTDPINPPSTPAHVDDAIYVGNADNKFVAVDAPTSLIRWQATVADYPIGRPTVANGVLYGADRSKTVSAFNTTTGMKQWESRLASSALSGTLLLDDKTCYVGADYGVIYALDRRNGIRQWTTTVGSSGLTLANNTLFATGTQRKLAARSATSGEQYWELPLTNPYTAPITDQDHVYILDEQTLYAIKQSTGVVRWKSTLSNVSGAYLALANGVLYVGANSKLLAINATSGTQKWEFPIYSHTSGFVYVHEGTVYAEGLEKLYAIEETTGRQKWAFDTPGNFQISDLNVLNGIVYVGNGDGTDQFYAVDATTGLKKWEYTTGYAHMALGYNAVYLTTWNKQLYALNLATGAKKWEVVAPEAWSTDLCVTDKSGNVIK